MVNGSNHAEHKCIYIGELYCESDQCQWMPKFTISGDTGNGQFPAAGTDYITFRADNILLRRKRDPDIKFRQ